MNSKNNIRIDDIVSTRVSESWSQGMGKYRYSKKLTEIQDKITTVTLCSKYTF